MSVGQGIMITIVVIVVITFLIAFSGRATKSAMTGFSERLKNRRGWIIGMVILLVLLFVFRTRIRYGIDNLFTRNKPIHQEQEGPKAPLPDTIWIDFPDNGINSLTGKIPAGGTYVPSDPYNACNVPVVFIQRSDGVTQTYVCGPGATNNINDMWLTQKKCAYLSVKSASGRSERISYVLK